MTTLVDDPGLIDQLEQGAGAAPPSAPPPTPVTDPALLAHLNGTPERAPTRVFDTELISQLEQGVGKTPEALAPTPPPAIETSPLSLSETIDQQAGRSAREALNKLSDVATGIKSVLQGGTFLQPPHAPEAPNPQLDAITNAPITEGYNDPRWWGAKITGGVVGGAGALAGGAVGAMLGGPVGAAAGAGGAAFGTEIIPQYNAAKAAGLSHDDALSQAVKGAGIEGVTNAVMGGIGLTPVLGALPIRSAMARAAGEALAQFGVIQPAIGAAGQAAGMANQGQAIDTSALAEGAAVNIAMSVPFVGAHIYTGFRETRPVTSQTRQQVQEAVGAPTPAKPIAPSPEALAPAQVFESIARDDNPLWFSQVAKVVENQKMENASGSQWLGTIRNAPGVKPEEVNALQLPSYLADAEGKVSKSDLLAHIEANQLQLEEVHLTDANVTPQMVDVRARELRPDFDRLPQEDQAYALLQAQREFHAKRPQYEEYTLPGPKEDYGEVILKVPGEVVFRAPHFSTEGGLEENIIGHVQWSERFDRDGKKTLFLDGVQSDWIQTGKQQGFGPFVEPEVAGVEQTSRGPGQFQNRFLVRMKDGREVKVSGSDSLKEAGQDAIEQLRRSYKGVPEAPFKSSWEELLFKRMLRFAADRGFERIAWPNGEQIAAMFPGAEVPRELYDRKLPGIAAKWGKKLGMEGGETAFERSRGVRYLDVSPAAGSRIRLGLPLYSKVVPGEARITSDVPRQEVPGTREAGNQVFKIIQKLETEMKLGEKHGELNFSLVFKPEATWRGLYYGRGAHPDKMGANPEISINLAHVRTAEGLYATAAHELGHHIATVKWSELPPELKLKIQGEYEDFRARLGADPTMGELLRARDNAVSLLYSPPDPKVAQTSMLAFSAQQRAYWAGFDEWFAESVAKWATTSQKPLSFVEKFFSSLGAAIRNVVKVMTKSFGKSFEPSSAMKQWLDSFIESKILLGPDEIAEAQLRTQLRNKRALEDAGAKETPAVPFDPGTEAGRNITGGVGLPPEGRARAREMAAHADRINSFQKWMYSLQQLAAINPKLLALQIYREIVEFFHTEKLAITNEGHLTTRFAQKNVRGKEQNENFANFLDHYRLGKFMKPDETVMRRPTAPELDSMERQYKMTDGMMKTFGRMVGDFDRMLARYREILVRDSRRIGNPLDQAKALTKIDEEITRLKSQPYMPNMRFGNFALTHYDGAQNVAGFWTFETARARDAAKLELERTLAPELRKGNRLLPGFMQPEVRTLYGMPPGLLDLMAEKLNLSQGQRGALDQLKFEYAPAQSFRHRFQNKEHTPGWSRDWLRSYSSYMFHGANHFARVKWVDSMRDQISTLKDTGFRLSRDDATKLDQIRAFMSNHSETILDPKPDWGALRGATFHIALGFSPIAAAINLTQTALMTHPFLASKFGDLASIAKLVRNSLDFNNFMRKGKYSQQSAGKTWAIGEGIRVGTLSETQAHHLAALSAGGFFSKPGWQGFFEASAKMFELTEQANRRLAFSSAYDLAMENPGAKHVREVVGKNQLQFGDLLQRGRTKQEAAAYLVAKDAVDWTQFQYQREARPRLFQGRKSALFIFKSFMTNTMINSYISGPGHAVRGLLTLGALAGVAGLPFAEDIKNVVKLIGKIWNKDWDIEDAARRYVSDVTNGEISPDVLLHGMSRYGFGFPQVMNLFGTKSKEEGRGYSNLSQNLSMGRVVPGIAELAQATKDPQGQELRAIQQLSGPAFSYGYDLYKFLTSSPFADPEWKKYELLMPRALRNASAAFRWGIEGEEKSKTGAAVLRFDVGDPFQMAEVVGKALGATPTALSARWDLMSAQKEAATFHDVQRVLLMKRFTDAVDKKDVEARNEIKQEIINFNRSLPKEARGKAISSESLRQSVENRLTTRAKQERGLPLSNKDLPLYRDLEKLYPEGVPAGVVGAKRVR